jgi:hypothetical protein
VWFSSHSNIQKRRGKCKEAYGSVAKDPEIIKRVPWIINKKSEEFLNPSLFPTENPLTFSSSSRPSSLPFSSLPCDSPLLGKCVSLIYTMRGSDVKKIALYVVLLSNAGLGVVT